jgi:hypothetical protein
VIVFYIAAGALLYAGLVAGNPFKKTDFIIIASVCLLLARFVRIERRLDKIEGIQRKSKFKSALSWAQANRSSFITITIVAIAVGIACFWYSWRWFTQ